MNITVKQKQIIKQTFIDALEEKMFQVSIRFVLSIGAALIAVAAGVGYFFGQAVLFSLVTLVAIIGLLIYRGPVIDSMVKYQARQLLKAIEMGFKQMPDEERAVAIDHVASCGLNEIREAIKLVGFGQVVVCIPTND